MQLSISPCHINPGHFSVGLLHINEKECSLIPTKLDQKRKEKKKKKINFNLSTFQLNALGCPDDD